MKGRMWSIEDEDFLRTNPEKTNKEISEKLGRPISSVRAKRANLGLFDSSRWTSDEIDFLKNNYQTKSDKEIAQVLGRDKSSISHARHRLGLSERKCFPKFTNDDDTFIKENYKTKTSREIGSILKRTSSSISRRIQCLGLTYGKSQRASKWTKEQEQILRDNYLIKSDSELAELVGKTRFGVEGYRHFKKLFKPRTNELGKRGKWKKVEEEILRKYSIGKDWICSVELHEKYLPSRSAMAIQIRRNILGLKEPHYKITKECENCHKKFEVFPCHKAKRFCSRKCCGEAKAKDIDNIIWLHVNDEMLTFLNLRGHKRCEYIRGLIEADMKKCKVN